MTATNPSAPTTDITVKKKTGKASAKMTSDADGNAKIEKDKMGYYTNT